MKIVYDRYATNTGAFDLIAEAWNELVQEGLTPDRLGVSPVTANCEVLYAVSEDGDVVGFIAYETHDPFGLLIEVMTYVEPSSRRRGVYKELMAELKKRAKHNRLTSAVPLGCKDMIAAKRHFAAKPTMQTFDAEL